MQREKEIALLDEVLGLRKAASAYLDAEVSASSVERYTDAERFGQERERIFLRTPVLLAHASELASDGDFLVRELAGVKVLMTRDREGAVHAFLNVCRHRGMELVPATSGCRHRFTCPYHAWTWDNRGKLIAVPHREQGFPDLDEERYGLHRVSVVERHGWIWVQVKGPMNLDGHLGEIGDDFDWAGIDGYEVHDITQAEWNGNWKIFVEGGLEAYHFRVAHAKTIAPMFHDNLSTYERIGSNIRSVLAKRSVDELVELPTEQWSIREHSNLLYTLMPGVAVLIMADHLAVVQMMPRAVDRSLIRVTTLRPKGELSASAREYWDTNHTLTYATLVEDFEIGEKIHQSFASGANRTLTFGRYEGALEAFNRAVENGLTRDPEAIAAE